MYTKITAAMKKSTIQSWVGITPTAPWTRSRRASSRVGGLVEPFIVGRLLDSRLRHDGLQRAKHPHTPRVDCVSLRALTHPVPLAVNNRTAVADELAGQLAGSR